MKEQTVFITGATGLIGRSIVKYLLNINRSNASENIKVVLATRDPEKCRSIMKDVVNQNNISIYPYRNTDRVEYAEAIDWIICAGAVTKKPLFKSNPVEVYEQNMAGISHCLQYMREHPIKGMVFLSSAVIYGESAPIYCPEDYIGTVDYAREAYAASKISGELLCNSFYEEYNIPVKIARVYQVYGNDMEYERGTFLTELFTAYKEKRPYVEIRSDGKNIRNMLHAEDCASALWHILLYGKEGETYNVGSSKSYSLLEIAQIVVDSTPDWHPKIIIKNEFSGENDIQVPNIDKLIETGWKENKADFQEEIKKILNLSFLA